MSTGTHEGQKLLNVWLPEPLHGWISELAKSRKETKSDFLRRAVAREAAITKGTSDDG